EKHRDEGQADDPGNRSADFNIFHKRTLKRRQVIRRSALPRTIYKRCMSPSFSEIIISTFTDLARADLTPCCRRSTFVVNFSKQ
ncbi:MAG: hypothetical protein ACSHW6_09820, partial [Sulfitobacter geojensis]